VNYFTKVGNIYHGGCVKGVDVGEEIDDLKLIESIRQGDERAFRLLVNRWRQRLVNFCSRRLGNPIDGEEVAQEVCVVLYEKLSAFRGDSQFSTWLYRIAVNRCNNRHGSWWSRLKRQGKRVSSVDRETSEIAVVDSQNSPEQNTQIVQAGKLLMDHLQTLPQNFRDVVIFRDLEDLSYEEIARITGCSEGTVKSRISRGRAMLQELVAEVRHEF